ncbi:metallophosphoesterase family protein [Bacillus sp. RO3]|nr:metallophosphoesterase family protein [Bacillus sp. RO3]
MKIVFFSDIHGNKYVLPSFLKAMEKENPDYIIFCGDIFGYYYYQNEIINVFRDKKYITLLGNHDQYFLDIVYGHIDQQELIDKYGNSYYNIQSKITKDNISFIKNLKPYYELNLNDCNIGVFHGSPSNPLNGRVYPDTEITDVQEYKKYDYVILGHTHHKMARKLDSTIILNPGSIGQQRDGKGCSYLILDVSSSRYEFKTVDYEIEELIKDINQHDQGNPKLKEVLLRKEMDI